MVKKDPKRYTFDKPNGKPSDPFGLALIMEAATRNVKVGDGAFIAIRGGHYHHPGLSRIQVLKLTREMLRSIPIGSGVVIENAKGQRVFHAKRVATTPYRNPFRDVAMSPARIDAGVDYCGNGPVYPLGRAKIINVGTPSHTTTFGSDMAVYQLLDGPARGKFVFFAEHYDTEPGYKEGDVVDTDTVLYRMNGCIEIGWSDGRGSIAWNIAPDSIEGQRTVWGDNFNDLLVSIDCMSGLTQGLPITMKLSPGWPTDW